jgi:hypothetical protein
MPNRHHPQQNKRPQTSRKITKRKGYQPPTMMRTVMKQGHSNGRNDCIGGGSLTQIERERER